MQKNSGPFFSSSQVIFFLFVPRWMGKLFLIFMAHGCHLGGYNLVSQVFSLPVLNIALVLVSNHGTSFSWSFKHCGSMLLWSLRFSFPFFGCEPLYIYDVINFFYFWKKFVFVSWFCQNEMYLDMYFNCQTLCGTAGYPKGKADCNGDKCILYILGSVYYMSHLKTASW